MEIKLKQQKFKYNFKYDIYINANNHLYAEANRTSLPFISRTVQFLKDDILLGTMKEQMIFKKFLFSLPLIGVFIELFTKHKYKYIINENNVEIGYIDTFATSKIHYININYKGQYYRVYSKQRGQIDNYYLFDQDKQIGLICKEPIVKWNAEVYNAKFNYDLDRFLCIMIMTFIDLAYYTNDRSNSIESTQISGGWYLKKNKDIDDKLNDHFKPKHKS